MRPNIFGMQQTSGLLQMPTDALTGDIRQLLSQTQGQQAGGWLTAGLSGLATQHGYQALQALARQNGYGRQPIAMQLTLGGQTINLALTPSDVHVAEEIDTFLAGYAPAEFRADEAVPIVPVGQLTDKFRTFTENNAFRVVNVLASTQSSINEIDPQTILRTYNCIDRAIGGFIPNVTQHVAVKAFDPRQALARRIRWALALEREVRIWGGTTGVLTNTANWNANNVQTIGAGNEWNTALGDPIRDMFDAEEASVMPITDWWLPTPTFNAFILNLNVRAYLRTMIGDDSPSADIQQRSRDIRIPGLATIHKVEGKVLNETTGNIEFIMGDRAVATRSMTGLVNPEDIQTAVTFRFDGPSGTGYITREFEVPGRGLHAGQMMVSGYSEDPRFIANNVGALIVNTMA